MEEFIAEIESAGFQALDATPEDDGFYCEIRHSRFESLRDGDKLAVSFYPLDACLKWYVSYDFKTGTGETFNESLQWVLDYFKDFED